MTNSLVKQKNGMVLAMIIIFAGFLLILAGSIATWSASISKYARHYNDNISALNVAEAAMNKYMWQREEKPTDYCNGEVTPCTPGNTYTLPTKTYKDNTGKVIGTYAISVTPPTADPKIKIKTVATVNGITRSISAEVSLPTFANYALFLNNPGPPYTDGSGHVNTELWVGSGETINGPVFTNHTGMRVDGQIIGNAYSTENTYKSDYFNTTYPGIKLNGGSITGSKVFPTSPIDFAGKLASDFTAIRDESKIASAGDHYYNSSGGAGYHITLGSSANKYTIKKVNSYQADPTHLDHLKITSESDIPGKTNISYPSGGVIFCEDNVWINGTIGSASSSKKITVFAADPEAPTSSAKSIYIPNNIKYTHLDGTDKLGLISQKDILVLRTAPTDMSIHAAMVAKDGVISFDFDTDPGTPGTQVFPLVKNIIHAYGSIAHNNGLIFGHVNAAITDSGYNLTDFQFDTHNVLDPPPHFPVTGQYGILNWREEN